jgi:oxalate decarboxylase/phosphoglucose isomerase-like protein (cupin superfamily)
MRSISEWTDPSPEQFRNDILPQAEPAVLRGIAASWPLVNAGENWMALLAARANDEFVEILRANPDQQGRFHYNADGQSLNFIRGRANLSTFLAALREQAGEQRPYAMVVQGMVADRYVPGFSASHPMPMVPVGTEPRIWVGNAAKVATHNDPVDNIAVVAAGRRRFTLFPPDAEDDLYLGPAHPTPAGTPVSMVHVTAPDVERYPRFARALDVAREAELSPGDAIFIPRDWFHHVEAIEPFNMLVNYWWGERPGVQGG